MVKKYALFCVLGQTAVPAMDGRDRGDDSSIVVVSAPGTVLVGVILLDITADLRHVITQTSLVHELQHRGYLGSSIDAVLRYLRLKAWRVARVVMGKWLLTIRTSCETPDKDQRKLADYDLITDGSKYGILLISDAPEL